MNRCPQKEVARLYQLGLTMAEIAGLYGVSEWTVASRLDQAGVPRRRTGAGQPTLPLERAVRRYHRQPHRLSELAAELSISADLIVNRSRQPKRDRRGQSRDRADVPADEVASLYQAGRTVSQIAGKYQVAASTVLRRLKDAGLTRRPKSTPVPFPVEEAARRVRQEGTSLAQLARDYHIGVNAVRGQLRARSIRAAPRTGPRVLRGIPAAEITSLYTAGLTITAIAARYGVSPDTISARLRSAGVTPRRVPSPPTKPIPVDEAATRYRQGATITELAVAYAVSARTMRRALAAAGVAIRPPGGARIPIPTEEAAQLYASGQTLRQIASRYGVCATVIYDRLKQAGVPLRRKTDYKQVDPGLLSRLAQQAGLELAP